MADYMMREQAPLTGDEWNTLDQAVMQVARRILVARRFMPIFGPVGAGVQSFAADRFPAPEKAEVSLFAAEEKPIVIQSRRFVPLPILYRDFRLEWRDLETSRRLGIPLEATAAAMAASAVTAMEDQLVFNGSDELLQEGFLNADGRQRLPLGDWGSMGGAFAAVVNAVQTLTGANFRGPYTVVVPPQLFALLNRVFDNTGVLEIDQIQRLVGGGVYMTPALPPDVAVVVDAGPENMDLLIAEDLSVAFLETAGMEHFLRVLEIVAPRIKRPGAVCVLGQG